MRSLFYVIILSSALCSFCALWTATPCAEESKSTRTQVTDGEEFKSILAALENKRKSICDFSARFTQVKILVPFNDEEKATGTVNYKSPDKIQWEFLTPEPSKVLVKGNRGYIIMDTLKQVQIFNIEKNNQFEFLLAGWSKPLYNYFFDFNVKCFKGSQNGAPFYTFVLTPKEAELSRILKQFELTIDGSLLIPNSSKLVEVSGDVTTMLFSQIRINTGITPAFFEYKIPPNYEVVDYRGTR